MQLLKPHIFDCKVGEKAPLQSFFSLQKAFPQGSTLDCMVMIISLSFPSVFPSLPLREEVSSDANFADGNGCRVANFAIC